MFLYGLLGKLTFQYQCVDNKILIRHRRRLARLSLVQTVVDLRPDCGGEIVEHAAVLEGGVEGGGEVGERGSGSAGLIGHVDEVNKVRWRGVLVRL